MKKMRTTIIISIALPALTLLATSCNRDYALSDPSLQVSAPAEVKAGQRVTFTLSGEQDILSFWSGENGNDYTYRFKDRVGEGDMALNFKVTTASGVNGHPNPSSLPFSYSTDFSGEYSIEAMNAATWKDITSDFVWPDDVGVSNQDAGTYKMENMFPDAETPVYLRFYYHVNAFDATLNGGAGNGRTQWTVNALRIFSETPAGDVTAYNMYDQDWHLLLGDGCETIPSANLPALPTTSERLLFRSQFRPEVDLHAWAISGPIHKVGEMNLGRDKAMGIKSSSDPQLRSFTYIYNKPGNYHVAFVGVNASSEGHREVVRELDIKVVKDSSSSVFVPFDVTAEKLEAAVGETVVFRISGDASRIGCWTGEEGHDIAYASTPRTAVKPLTMSFKHAISAGTQNNHPLIKISNDFSGTMTEAAILQATWTDISEHFTFATTNLGSSNPITSNLSTYNQYFVDSGVYDISQYCSDGDSAYVAMFWHADKYDSDLDNTRTVSYVTRWEIGSVFAMSPQTITFVWDEDKWSGVSASNTPAWQTPKNDVPDYPAFRFMADFRPAGDRDAYAVTNTAVKASEVNLGFDQPVTVQAAGAITPGVFTHAFEAAGIYQVVFVAETVDESGNAQTVQKSFTITVN